jgi:hypothetical protein
LVQCFVGDLQIGQQPIGNNGFLDDPRYIVELHVSVPDSLRIDHDGWSEFALVEATGAVDAYQGSKSPPLDLGFELLA